MTERQRLLHGGYINETGVAKQGNSVVRLQDHPWPQVVSEALNALSEGSFKHCPREVKRLDSCSVVLTYMPGKALPNPVPRWAASTKTMLRVASLVRGFSLAAEGLGNKLTHSDWLIPPMSDGDVLVHGDPHPTNIIFSVRRRPVAIIDFELATLGTHDWNLVSLIFSWAPLEPIHLTCWREISAFPVAERIRTILEYWPPESSAEHFIETAHAFIKWRQAWIAKLASLGNPGATTFINDPNFEKRYQYGLDLLEKWIA
jgi:Phosphotransferase enzyme family